MEVDRGQAAGWAGAVTRHARYRYYLLWHSFTLDLMDGDMTPSNQACPFCTLAAERILKQNEHGVWVMDAYPVSPGHSLVIPRRHVGSFFELTNDERLALLSLLEEAKAEVSARFNPDGYNIGINDGPAAGQTVPHLHIHLIPRYKGDLPDPRGGVRWVIPAKADYWSQRG